MIKVPYFLLSAIFMLLVSCQTTSNKQNIPEMLLTGSQEEIDEITNQIVKGEIRIKKEWLEDMREFPRHIVLQCTDTTGRFWQLGVDKITDYFLCLLQVMHDTDTQIILNKIAPENQPRRCPPIDSYCEVCNSRTHQLNPPIQNILIEYWTKYLDDSSKRSDKGEVKR